MSASNFETYVKNNDFDWLFYKTGRCSIGTLYARISNKLFVIGGIFIDKKKNYLNRDFKHLTEKIKEANNWGEEIQFDKNDICGYKPNSQFYNFEDQTICNVCIKSTTDIPNAIGLCSCWCNVCENDYKICKCL